MMTALKHIKQRGKYKEFRARMCLGVTVGTQDCQFGMHC